MPNCLTCGAMLDSPEDICPSCGRRPYQVWTAVPPTQQATAPVPSYIGQAGWVPDPTCTPKIPSAVAGPRISRTTRAGSGAVSAPAPARPASPAAPPAVIAAPSSSERTAADVSASRPIVVEQHGRPMAPRPEVRTQVATEPPAAVAQTVAPTPASAPASQPMPTAASDAQSATAPRSNYGVVQFPIPAKRQRQAIIGLIFAIVLIVIAFTLAADAGFIGLVMLVVAAYNMTRSLYSLMGWEKVTVAGQTLILERQLFGKTFRTLRFENPEVGYAPLDERTSHARLNSLPALFTFSRGVLWARDTGGIAHFGEALDFDPVTAKDTATRIQHELQRGHYANAASDGREG